VVSGVEFLYPIEHWSDAMVERFLQANLPEALTLYKHLRRSGDCMRCSAWLGDNRVNYLKANHPVAFEDLKKRLHVIASSIQEPVAALMSAVKDARTDEV
jgi:hypothetical protein